MYGDDIDGTTLTVGFEAMTALKRDATALIPAPLVPELKGIRYITSRGVRSILGHFYPTILVFRLVIGGVKGRRGSLNPMAVIIGEIHEGTKVRAQYELM